LLHAHRLVPDPEGLRAAYPKDEAQAEKLRGDSAGIEVIESPHGETSARSDHQRGSPSQRRRGVEVGVSRLKNAGLRWRRAVERTAVMGQFPTQLTVLRNPGNNLRVDQSLIRRPNWPISKPRAAYGLAYRCGLDRACCSATVSHPGSNINVFLMQEATATPLSQRPLTRISTCPHNPLTAAYSVKPICPEA
jgi:hypothetical protein